MTIEAVYNKRLKLSSFFKPILEVCNFSFWYFPTVRSNGIQNQSFSFFLAFEIISLKISWTFKWTQTFPNGNIFHSKFWVFPRKGGEAS